MGLFNEIGKVYQVYGYKLFVYPLACAFLCGVVWALLVNKMPEIFAFLLLCFLFGLSLYLIGMLFGFNKLIWYSLISCVILIGCYLISIAYGLYSGSYFLPVAFGNILFACSFFVLDRLLIKMDLNFNLFLPYLAAAILSLLTFYIFTYLDWKKETSWFYLVAYPIVIYFYLQANTINRLMFNFKNP